MQPTTGPILGTVRRSFSLARQTGLFWIVFIEIAIDVGAPALQPANLSGGLLRIDTAACSSRLRSAVTMSK